MSGPRTTNPLAQVQPQGSTSLHDPIPAYEPEPSTLYSDGEGMASSSTSRALLAGGGPTASEVLSVHSLVGQVPADAPPSYNVARIPDYPVTYTFSSLGLATSAMILVPPPDSPDTRPLYHISVSHDPFLPHCCITSVLRGGSPDGSYIGGFTSMFGIEALKNDAETVCIRECEHPLLAMFKETTVKRKGMACPTFAWYSFNSKRAMKWTTSTNWPQAGSSSCILLSDPKQAKVAEFTAIDQLRKRGQPVFENTLMVMPAGYPHFDDILISALLLERRRKMERSTNAPWNLRS